MNAGGLTTRIIRFSNVIVGHMRGGLAQITVVASMFFGGISGSATADLSAIGSILIPSMKREGYDPEFAVAMTSCAATCGPIIPPSITMIIYSILANVSITQLFLGGYVPGIMMGLSFMVVNYFISRRRNYPMYERSSFRKMLVVCWEASGAVILPFIILGGLLSGVFTVTEAAGVSAVYAIVISVFVYRDLTWRDLPRILAVTAIKSGVLMTVAASALIFAWVLSYLEVPQMIVTALFSITRDKHMILLMLNILFLIVGCFMEAKASMLILLPVILPVIPQVGIDLIHFGVVITFNLMEPAGFEEHAQGQLVGPGRPVRVFVVRETDRGVVHRPHHVAGEGGDGVLHRGPVGEFRVEDVAFLPAHGLHGHQVRVGAGPPARQGAAVKVEHDLEIGRVPQDCMVEANGLLLVALEEIHLDSLDAPLAEQLQLEPAHLLEIEAVARFLGDDVVRPAGVVPEQHAHAFLLRMAHHLVDVAVVHDVPVGVHQHVFPAHLRRKIHKLDLLGGVLGTGLVRPPAPGHLRGWTVSDIGGIAAALIAPTVVDDGKEQGIPTAFALDQNYPNPFNPTTTIKFALPQDASVTLKIYNLLGQEVVNLVDEPRSTGYHQVQWNGRNQFGNQVATGVYFYRIEAKPVDGSLPFTNLKKMLLLK